MLRLHDGVERGFTKKLREADQKSSGALRGPVLYSLEVVAALAKQRVGARLDGIDLELAVLANRLARSAQKSKQSHGQRTDHQETVATKRIVDMGLRKAQAQVGVLGVAKGFFTGKPLAVQVDGLAGGQVGAAGGQTPGILHIMVVDKDHCTYGILLSCHPGSGQSAGPMVGGYKLPGLLTDSLAVRHQDVLTEADDVVHVEFPEIGIQLLVTETAIRHDGNAHGLGN